MAVFKATKNRKKVDEQNVFKATDQKSTDVSVVNEIENRITEDSDKLNEYINRRKEGKYISSEEVNSYREAANRYKSNRDRYNSIIKSTGGVYDADAETEHSNWLSGVLSDMDSSYEFYSQFKTEDEYNAWDVENTRLKNYGGKSYSELNDIIYITPEGEEKEWLKKYANASMKPEDYDAEIHAIDNEISGLEAVLSQYDEHQYTRSGEYTQAWYRDFANKYGTKEDVESKIEELRASKWDWENKKKYGLLPENEDFVENSGYVSTKFDEGFSWDKLLNNEYGMGYADLAYEYINNPNIRGEIETQDAIYSHDGPSLSWLAGEESSYADKGYDRLKEDEIAIYNYLYQTEGADAAQKYLDYMEHELTNRDMEAYQQEITELADKFPVLTSIASVPENLKSGIGFIDVAYQNLENSISEGITGEYAAPINYNTSSMKSSVASSTIRGTVAQNIADKTGVIDIKEEDHPVLAKIFNGKSLGDVYQLGMSMADSAAVALMSPVVGTAGTALLGGSAATQGVLNAVANGATDEQAIWMGVLNGGFEMLFEKYELEHLLGADTNMVKAIFNQAFTEGIGEGATTIANSLADVFVMAENSDWQKKIDAYIANGYSHTDAKKQAFWDAVIQVGWDSVGGMISGGVMGAGGSIVNSINNKLEQSEAREEAGQAIIEQGNVSNLVEQAEALGDKNAAKLATKVAKVKTDEVTGSQHERYTKDVGRLYDKVTSLQQKKALNSKREVFREAVKREIAQRDNIENADEAAKVIFKAMYVGSLRKSEVDTFDKVGGREIMSSILNSKDFEAETQEATSKAIGEFADTIGLAMPKQSTNNEIEEADVSEFDISADGVTRIVDSNEAVEINEITNVSADNVTVALDNGSEADIYDLSLANNDVAVVIRGIQDMNSSYGIDAMAANRVYKLWNGSEGIDANTYILGADAAIRYGTINYEGNLDSAEYVKDLPVEIRNELFEEGRRIAQEKADKQQADIDGAKADENKKTPSRKTGKVSFDGVDRAELTAAQVAQVNFIETVFGAMGIDVEFFRSKKDKLGRSLGESGSYNVRTKKIRIDVNAGNSINRDSIVYTASHELTHFIRDWSPKKFKAFADFLVENYSKNDISVDELINSKIEASKGELSYDDAYEEVIAESCQAFLMDSDAKNKLIELAKQDKSLAARIMDFIKDLLAALDNALKGLVAEGREAAYVREMTDAIDELHRLWDDALFDAVDAYQRTDAHNSTTDGVKYHLRSYSQKEKDNWANSKRIVLYESEEQYREFIQTSLSDKKYDKKMYFGAIPNDFAQFIQSKTGLNVENFNCTLAANEIRKIINSHGNEAVENKRGQRAVTEDDFVNIPTVIQDSDDITLSPNLYNGKPVINFVKNLNGRITVSAVISDKHLDLYVQTAFVNIKKGNLATPTGEQAPINTPEASRGTVSNNRISEKIEDVNINDKKTEKKQIRENVPTVDELGINKKLKNQNKKLKGDVRELRELLRLQKEVTHGKKFKKSSIEAAASVLMKRFELTRGKETMAQQLEKFYEFIAASEQLTWDDIEAEAMGIVDYVNGEKVGKAKRDSYAQDVLNAIRSAKIEFSDMQMTEAASKFGSYNSFRKAHFGSLNIGNNGIPLDVQWQEWAEMYPDMFDADTTSNDMPGVLSDLIDSLKQAYEIDEIVEDDARDRWMVQEIYDSYWNISTLHTVADNYQQKINLLKSKHRETMDSLREEHTNELKNAKERGRELVKKVRETKDARLKEYKAAVKEQKEKQKNTRERRTAIEKLHKLVLTTSDWIDHPKKNELRCPDILKEPYADFLASIDLSSKRKLEGGADTKADQRLALAMNALANTVDRIKTAQDPSAEAKEAIDIDGYLDLPKDFVLRLRKMAEGITDMMKADSKAVYTMAPAEIKEISKLIRTLNHAIREMGTLYKNLRFANVEELGYNSIEYMDSLGKINKTSGVGNFVKWNNALPYYAFKRFGQGGESVLEELMDAQDQLAFNAKTIFDFKNKSWTDKEANAWSKDTHTILLSDGNKVTLTTADAMSIYCLTKREHAVPHLLGGGIRVIGKEKNGTKSADSKTTLTAEDIDTITDSLTDRQREVASVIQQFMSSVCAEWGNEISLKRFLTRDFNEKYYFPIESSDENLDTRDPQAQQSDLYRLLNISATKPLTEGANNQIVIRNIFDVFTNHTTDMARLNAFGMALLDYMKWINYRVKSVNENGQIDTIGVRRSMNDAYGDAARSYTVNLIKDINGRSGDGGEVRLLMKLAKNAKTASVGFNARVAALQVTSYPRASLVLSVDSMLKGLSKKPSVSKAQKYCGIALWKSFGFYDTNIARSIEEQIRGSVDVRQKLIEISLKGAEWGDAITWGYLWNACEYEIAKTKQYKVGTDEFNQAVSNKLREVVYSTQVVDSILTRSQIMRSKHGLAQTATAFMSEPTVSANIIMNAFMQFGAEKRKSDTSTAWKKTSGLIGRSLAVYSVGQITAAFVESLFDAWRDDDDDEFINKYKEVFAKNLLSDLFPGNKLPIFTDITDWLFDMVDMGYYSSDRIDMTALSYAKTAIETWNEVISEKRGGPSTIKTCYNALYNTVRAISSAVGVSGSGIMRDAVALWNNTAGAYDVNLKIRGYERSNAQLGNSLYDAIISGNERQAASLETQFESQDDMNAALRKAMRQNDSRIREAAEAKIAGEITTTYRELIDEIVSDGFSKENVVKAIEAEANKLKKELNTDDEASSSETDDEAYVSIYSVGDINTALAKGDMSSAKVIIDYIVKVKTDNGKTEKEARSSIRSSLTSYWKPLYLEAYNDDDADEMEKISKMLFDTGLYGKSVNQVISTCNDWIKQNKDN